MTTDPTERQPSERSPGEQPPRDANQQSQPNEPQDDANPGYGQINPTRADYSQPGAFDQPGSPAQPGYGAQPGYASQPGYSADPGYPAQPVYPAQPGYTAQPGYPQGAYPPPGYPSAPGPYAVPGVPYPPQAYGVDQWGRPLSDKSKVVAGVLQLVLGGLGIGRFYIGDNRTAIWQIVVTVFTCGLGHIWGIIDGILILVNGGVDAQGRVLRD